MNARGSGGMAGAFRRREWSRVVIRVLRDEYFVYTALLAPVAYLAALAIGSYDEMALAMLVTPPFLVAQALAGLAPSSGRAGLGATAWSILRLLVALVFVGVMVNIVGGPQRPLLSLYLPVVVAASALGRAQAIAIGGLAAAVYLSPLVIASPVPTAFEARAIGHAGVAILLTLATRQLLDALERAVGGLRGAVIAERRRSRQIAAMEAVGRALVTGGETPELMGQVVTLVANQFGYRYVSIYLWSDGALHLAAQRNYEHAPETIPPGRGVVGRVAETRQLVHLPEVAASADYIAVHPGVVSEVCAPLLVEGAFLGVLNVEATRGLDRTDRDLIATLADRVATVVALGHDRQALAERGALFRGLHEYAGALSATLQVEELARIVVEWTDRMVPADLVVMTLLDQSSGRYLMRAGKGVDPRTIGRPIRPGEGMAGRAIRDRVTVVDAHFGPDLYPAAVRGSATVATRVAMAVPLIRDTVVIGAITVGRAGAEAQLRPIEIEALELVAGHASLAVANAYLHAESASLAVHDPLTGLYNRRHFDEALERLVAGHHRDRLGRRRPLAAIMFDLDRFGQFNKDHGHQVGDAVLRAFARILAGRFRRADLVARYGGEEFVVILDNASLEDAQRAAEEVRAALAATTVPDEAGNALQVTVSAGCGALDETEPSAEGLLRTADVALFMAKRAGRDRVVAA